MVLVIVSLPPPLTWGSPTGAYFPVAADEEAVLLLLLEEAAVCFLAML